MSNLDELSAKDVADARALHAEQIKAGNYTAANFIYWYSWFWALSSTVYFFCVTFLPLPTDGKDFANIILGFLLGTAVATIIGFFYGNSNTGGKS